ncbi:hypothetical protein [Streptomyces sp. NPDC051657]|uniref:hypothetical protein n=1 Tax=unclassified Streptomyces TaxID=2593676 RepID=UPI003421B65D
MDIDARWERWCKRFDEADRDIRTLFHSRHIWLSINEMWEKNADAIELNTLVYNWHINLYVNTQCTGIRRECDSKEQTSSLENCLQELIKYPGMANRSRFEAYVDLNAKIEARFKATNKRKFDAFAEAPGSPDIDPVKVQTDIDRLRAAALTTRTYTNKVVAHRQHMTTKISLALTDLDTALNTVGEVLKRYYTLRHPPMIKGNLTPDLPLGWERPYQAAWCTPEYMPLEANPLDSYVHSSPQPEA